MLESTKYLELQTFNFLGINNLITHEKNRSKGIYSPSLIGKIAPLTKANDSVPIHWEMMGIHPKNYVIYEKGLPTELLEKIKTATQCDFVGNITVKTPEEYEYLLKIHESTGKPVIYCTNDSVVQIIASINNFKPEELYEIAKTIRKILLNKSPILRVVAKSFKVENGRMIRLEHLRKDFTLPFPTKKKNLLTSLFKNKVKIAGIGKILDFFPNVNFDIAYKSTNNRDGLEKVVELLNITKEDILVFVNLLDFDVTGHSKDITGFAELLVEMDRYLKEIINCMNKNDLLILTADHGCDPTISQIKTHTREYAPLIIFKKHRKKGQFFGNCTSFTNIASIISLFFKMNVLFSPYCSELLDICKEYIYGLRES